MRYAILCLLLACCGAFAQQPLAAPVPTPSSLSTARVIIKKLIGDIDAAQGDNAMLKTQLTDTQSLNAQTQKANLETQAQINKLSDFATTAQLEYQRASLDRDKAKKEAHENAKERDVFVFTICIIVTLMTLSYLTAFIPSIKTGWPALAMWIAATLVTFGVTYAFCRFVLSLFARMIP